MNKEVAKLWLYENTLTTTTTSIGVRNSAQTAYTWFVNMKDVLGETLWSKYEYFQMQLTFFARINTSTYNYIEGLNIIQTSKAGVMQGNSALVSTVIVPYGTEGGDRIWDSYAGAYQYIITKPVDNRIPLTVYWQPVTGANASSTYGSYFFTFQGLEKYNPLYKNPFNTFYNLEQRNFTLSTESLQAGATNSLGTMSTGYTSFSFTNINMRHILGTLWDKYDKFNLIMTSWGCGQPSSGTISGDQRQTYLIIEGLQFINSVAVGPSSTTSINRYGLGGSGILEATTGLAANGNLFDNMSCTNTFRKPESENVTLSFTVGNTTVFPSVNVYSNWIITFIVVGVSEK